MLSSYWLYDSLMNDGEIKSRMLDFFGNEWNWKSGRIFIFQNRLDSISSFISTLFDSWKDYEYRRGENYFLMVFLWRSVSRRRLKEMPRANGPWPIYFVNISKLSWMIYSFLCLKLRDLYLCASIKDYFANESEIDLEWLMIKKIGE